MAGKKLLVADDSLTIQKVIRLALSNEGYEIHAVSDGNDAIEQIAVFRPDAILIDVSLPGKTAFEVKRAINAHSDLSDIRFVLMSSAFEKVDEAQAQEVQFHGRLTKPFDPAHLRQVLSEVLRQVAARQIPSGPPALPSNDLWDHGSSLDDLPPALPPSHMPSMESGLEGLEVTGSLDLDFPDADIKHLTESTIRISGLADAELPPPLPSQTSSSPAFPPVPPASSQDPLGDFEWSVNEPSLRPQGGLLDSGNTTFEVSPPVITGISEATPELTLDEPSIGNLPMSEDIGNASSPSEFYKEATPPKLPDLPLPNIGKDFMPVSPEQIEELVRKELRETLQKMAERILPDMAEKLIKQEIHKMLSES